MKSPRPAATRAMLLAGWLGAAAVAAGADGLAAPGTNGTQRGPDPAQSARHWAFQALPARSDATPVTVDTFVRRRLKAAGLKLSPEADRATLIRRAAFILTGLPPTPEEIATFLHDRDRDAYGRMFERYLQSPRCGERWARHWLDAAGYADSNGYFNADTDRPLAYRYRDYVIRSLNRDKPFDQFVREQLAGDELSGWKPGQPATPAIVEQLEATHFLRNGQDGSGESDGNPDEVRADRYYALESAMQIIGSSLLGLTMQCAKCHDHKFEPLSQQDYYAFQAVLYPAFHIEKWVKPNDRAVHAYLPGEREAWEEGERRLDAKASAAKNEFRAWLAQHRVPGRTLFEDRFAPDAGGLGKHWAHTAPGDDTTAGTPAVGLEGADAPAARVVDGSLQIVEGGGSGDRWLCTQRAFDWRPAGTGQWIQVTFDLVATQLGAKGGAAERIGYLIAAHDFNDSSEVAGGNILIDGNPGGATTVHTDYPGADSKSRGSIGEAGYQAGRNYGVRVTRTGADDYTLEHLVDGAVDGGALKLRGAHLPPGGFAFEYCCGRSFVVDNVVVEGSDEAAPDWKRKNEEYQRLFTGRKAQFDRANKELAAQRKPKPGRIAWMPDVGATPPEVRLLKRGNPKTPGERVEPAYPGFLNRDGRAFEPVTLAGSSGRRLAWARWLTEPHSPQASLLARVTVNRMWQQYFGVGLAATPENLGVSGAAPTHPELLDWLAAELIESGWSLRAIHRRILESDTFRQASLPSKRGLKGDPENHLLWRFPLRRLDADAIRDAMLATSGRLGGKTNGPYVPTPRQGSGEVMVDEAKPDAFARTLFLQQRRTQVPTFLGTFDAPSIVFNCTRRGTTTMPLQSLSLLNSEFAVKRGADLARRIEREAGTNAAARVRRAFLLTTGREPEGPTREAALEFVERQRRIYREGAAAPAEERAWADLCQTLFGLNSFLYLE